MENSDKIPVYPTIPNNSTPQITSSNQLPTYSEATSYQQPGINNFQPPINGYPQVVTGNPRVYAVPPPNVCVVESHCPNECHEEWRIRHMDKKNIPPEGNVYTNSNDNNEVPITSLPPPPYVSVPINEEENRPINVVPPNYIIPNNTTPIHYIQTQSPPVLNSYPIVFNNGCGGHHHHHSYSQTRYPCTLYCFKCNNYVLSTIHYEKGQNYTRNLMILLFLCIICPPALCIIPILLLTNTLKDVIHKCPNCDTVIGIHAVN